MHMSPQFMKAFQQILKGNLEEIQKNYGKKKGFGEKAGIDAEILPNIAQCVDSRSSTFQ